MQMPQNCNSAILIYHLSLWISYITGAPSAAIRKKVHFPTNPIAVLNYPLNSFYQYSPIQKEEWPELRK